MRVLQPLPPPKKKEINMATTYNLIDEPWIKVRYNDGTVKEAGIRQVLMDAGNIKDILAPTFRSDKIQLHKVAVYRLLETIVMSAYFKEETKFAANSGDYLDDLKEQGLYTNAIKGYLDRFYDRFDLFSETHPFLQNIHLKDAPKKAKKKKEDPRVYLLDNPFAPSRNSNVFGKTRSADLSKKDILDQYEITYKEFAYIVLYFAFMHISFASTVNSEKSLRFNAKTFVVLRGKTLGDTILMNIMPLNNSDTDEDGKADKPVWELSDIHEIKEYEPENIIKQELLCTFFPGVSILGTGKDGKITNLVLSPNKKDEKMAFLDAIHPCTTLELSKAYKERSSIIKMVKKKDKDPVYTYFDPSGTEKNLSNEIWLQCLAATQTNPNKSYGCQLFEKLEEDCDVDIYFRNTDSQGMGITECGYVTVPNTKTVYILKDEQNHFHAESYRDYIYSATGALMSSVNELCAKSWAGAPAGIKKDLSIKITDWISKDFFGTFTEDLIADPKEAVSKAKERIMFFILSLFDDISAGMDVFEYARIRNKLYGILNKKKKEKKAKEKTS